MKLMATSWALDQLYNPNGDPCLVGHSFVVETAIEKQIRAHPLIFVK
jgi:hypothetical protein